jgi:hypothetical protein
MIRPPFAYLIRRMAKLAETGQCSSHLDIQAVLIEEGLPEVVDVLATRPGLRDYLDASCVRAKKEKPNA